jgi:hypothetical protein
VQALPELSTGRESKTNSIVGHIQNVSAGGICLMTSRPVEKASVLRCEIAVGDSELKIPTLMRVCWTGIQANDPNGYLAGLRFLF